MNNFLGTIYSPPTIYLVDGVVREKTIQDMANTASYGFMIVEQALGDLYGLSDSPYSTSRYNQSVASSLGNMHLASHEIPSGVLFTSYTADTFSDRSTIMLSLIPNDIDGIVISPGVFTRQNNIGDMTTAGDYHVNGRLITFFEKVNGNFSVTYDGLYPNFGDAASGYFPNVFPNPNLVDSLVVDKPTLTSVGSKRYRVVIPNTTMENALGESFPQPLDVQLNTALQTFVDGGGAVSCPLDLVSIWKKDFLTNTYRKINSYNIYIISPYIYEFETDESMSLLNDVCVVSLSNISVTEMLSNLYKEFKNHSHNTSSLAPLVSHSVLIDNDANDHRQYLNRNGYSAPDYLYNKMEGDILLSTIPADDNTYSILFGNDGVSIGGIDGDIVATNTNGKGFAIKTAYIDSPDIFYGALDIDGNTIRRENNTDNLIINTIEEDGIIKFTSAGTDTATIQSNKGLIEQADVKKVIFRDIDVENSTGVEFTESSGGVLITSVEPTGIVTATVKVIAEDLHGQMFIDKNTEDDSYGVYFGSEDIPDNPKLYTDVDPDDNAKNIAVLESTNPFTLRSNGISTGIAIDTLVVETPRRLLNIFASPVDGVAASNYNDIYLEVPDDAEFFFIQQNPEGPVVELPNRTRAAINALLGRFSTSVDVGSSSETEKNGLIFSSNNGSIQDGGIYVTSGLGECPNGIMVIESNNGVVFADLTAAITDCKTVKYAEVTMGDLQVYGSIIATDEISCGKTIKTAGDVEAKNGEFSGKLNVGSDVLFEGELTVNESARFLSDVSFNGATEFRDDAKFNAGILTSTIEVSGAASFKSSADFTRNILVNGTGLFKEDVSFVSNVNVGGELFVKSAEISTLSITRSIDCQGQATLGALEVDNNAHMKGGLVVDRSLELGGNIFGESSAAFLQKITILEDAEINKDLYVEGETILRGDVSVGTSGSDRLLVLSNFVASGLTFEVNGKTSLYQDLNVSGKVTLGSELAVKSRATVDGDIDVGGVIKISGSDTLLSAYTIRTENAEFSGNLTVEKDTQLKGNVFADKDFFVGGNFSSGGSFRAEGGIIAGDNSVSTVGDIRVNGRVIQTNNDFVNVFAGEIIAANEVKMNSTANVAGELSIGIRSTDNVTYISGNSIRVNGDTGKISSQNIEVSNLVGKSDVNFTATIYNVINENNYTIDGQESNWLKIGNTMFNEFAVFKNAVMIDDTLFVRAIKNISSDEEFIDMTSKECYYA